MRPHRRRLGLVIAAANHPDGGALSAILAVQPE
jgi:hypothetical protein